MNSYQRLCPESLQRRLLSEFDLEFTFLEALVSACPLRKAPCSRLVTRSFMLRQLHSNAEGEHLSQNSNSLLCQLRIMHTLQQSNRCDAVASTAQSILAQAARATFWSRVCLSTEAIVKGGLDVSVRPRQCFEGPPCPLSAIHLFVHPSRPLKPRDHFGATARSSQEEHRWSTARSAQLEGLMHHGECESRACLLSPVPANDLLSARMLPTRLCSFAPVRNCSATIPRQFSITGTPVFISPLGPCVWTIFEPVLGCECFVTTPSQKNRSAAEKFRFAPAEISPSAARVDLELRKDRAHGTLPELLASSEFWSSSSIANDLLMSERSTSPATSPATAFTSTHSVYTRTRDCADMTAFTQPPATSRAMGVWRLPIEHLPVTAEAVRVSLVSDHIERSAISEKKVATGSGAESSVTRHECRSSNLRSTSAVSPNLQAAVALMSANPSHVTNETSRRPQQQEIREKDLLVILKSPNRAKSASTNGHVALKAEACIKIAEEPPSLSTTKSARFPSHSLLMFSTSVLAHLRRQYMDRKPSRTVLGGRLCARQLSRSRSAKKEAGPLPRSKIGHQNRTEMRAPYLLTFSPWTSRPLSINHNYISFGTCRSELKELLTERFKLNAQAAIGTTSIVRWILDVGNGASMSAHGSIDHSFLSDCSMEFLQKSSCKNPGQDPRRRDCFPTQAPRCQQLSASSESDSFASKDPGKNDSESCQERRFLEAVCDERQGIKSSASHDRFAPSSHIDCFVDGVADIAVSQIVSEISVFEPGASKTEDNSRWCSRCLPIGNFLEPVAAGRFRRPRLVVQMTSKPSGYPWHPHGYTSASDRTVSALLDDLFESLSVEVC